MSQGCCPRIAVPPGCCHQHCDHATARVTRPPSGDLDSGGLTPAQSSRCAPAAARRPDRRPSDRRGTEPLARTPARAHDQGIDPQRYQPPPRRWRTRWWHVVDDSCGQRCPLEGRRPAPASNHDQPRARRPSTPQATRQATVSARPVVEGHAEHRTGRAKDRSASEHDPRRAQGSWSTPPARNWLLTPARRITPTTRPPAPTAMAPRAPSDQAATAVPGQASTELPRSRSLRATDGAPKRRTASASVSVGLIPLCLPSSAASRRWLSASLSKDRASRGDERRSSTKRSSTYRSRSGRRPRQPAHRPWAELVRSASMAPARRSQSLRSETRRPPHRR